MKVFTFLMFGFGSICSCCWHEFLFWFTGEEFLRLSHCLQMRVVKKRSIVLVFWSRLCGVSGNPVLGWLSSSRGSTIHPLVQAVFTCSLYSRTVKSDRFYWIMAKFWHWMPIQAQGGLLASHSFLPLILIQMTMKGCLRPHLHARTLKVIFYGFTTPADSPSPLTPPAIHFPPLLSVCIVRQTRTPHK